MAIPGLDAFTKFIPGMGGGGTAAGAASAAGGAASGGGWASQLGKMFSSAAPQIGASALGNYMGAQESNADRASLEARNAQSVAEQRRQFDLGRADQLRDFAENQRRFGIGQAQDAAAQKQSQFNLDRNFGQSQALTGLEATQMNPFTQQQARGKAALAGVLMNNFSPSTYNSEAKKWEGGLNLPSIMAGMKDYYSPSALAGAEQTFTRNVQAAAPTYQGNPLEMAGYGADVAAAARSAMPTRGPEGLPTAQSAVAPDFTPDLSAFAAPAASATVPEPTQAPQSAIPPGLMDQIRSFQVGSGPGALSGGAKGAALGSMVGPWGTAIGGGIGALAGALTGGEGKNTNRARDSFKSLFGDAQGTGMEKTLDPLYEKIPGLYDAHLQFNQAGKQKDLQSSISRLSSLLSGGY